MSTLKKFIVIITCIIFITRPLSVNRYVSTNITNIDNFKSSTIDLNNYDIFLNGETHGTGGTDKLKFDFVKYLNKKIGVNYILIERPFTYSELINKFLETGDISILNSHSYWEFESNESVKFLEKIYELNLSLPKDEKIKFIGIDIDTYIADIYKCMLELIPSNHESMHAIDSFENISNVDKTFITGWKTKDNSTQTIKISLEAIEVLRDIQLDLINNKDVYSNILGENYFKFTYLLENMIYCIEYVHSEDSSNIRKVVREENLYSNIIKVHNEYPNEKFLVQLGSAHVYKKPFYFNDSYFEPIGYMLNERESSPFIDKVLSFESIYINCGIYDPFKNQTAIYSDQLTIDIDTSILSNYSILNMNNLKSPFKKNSIDLVEKDEKVFMNNTTDEYFDYVFIYKDLVSPYKNDK